MEIDNNLNNNIKIENKINDFLETRLGQTINTAIDIGIRTILPDLIEEQIIDVKNSLLKNGLKSGINTAIKSAIDIGKSAVGIFTGKFENISQIETVIKNGGILDIMSDLLDKTTNLAYRKGIINNNINNMLIKGKDIILDNVSSNITKEFKNQNDLICNLNEYINNWKKSYENKDFSEMEKQYKNIENEMQEIIPLENIIKETRKIENIHNLIKNNGQNFELTEVEKELINKL